MIWSIAWRNIWRNKVRSIVVMSAIALGICAGIFSTAFFTGMMVQRIDQVISNELSHIQVHNPGFRHSSDLENFMPGAADIAGSIIDLPQVAGASTRMVVFSMIASPETATGVKIVGIHPADERKVSRLYEHIREGTYFEDGGKNPVLIGRELAEKLKVKLRSKVVITLQDLENNITGGAFRVAGIFETPNSMYDETTVFVQAGDLKGLLGLPPGAGHEIAVLASSNDLVENLQSSIMENAEGTEVLNWKQLSPEMGYLTEIMDLYMYIFIVIILFALLFGIINTMLMVVLERVKELGMLMAIGMNRRRIFTMIILETVLLTLTGGIMGMILGSAISTYFETHAIDLSMWAEGYRQLGYDTILYTSLDPSLLVSVTIMVIITGIIAAIYPALKALRNDPAEALRIE